MNQVNWIKPGKHRYPRARLTKGYLYLNTSAAEEIASTGVDIGVDIDGLLIIRKGDSYTISTSKAKDGYAKAQVGGPQLVKRLMEEGIRRGREYKLVYNSRLKYWEGYLQDKKKE